MSQFKPIMQLDDMKNHVTLHSNMSQFKLENSPVDSETEDSFTFQYVSI